MDEKQEPRGAGSHGLHTGVCGCGSVLDCVCQSQVIFSVWSLWRTAAVNKSCCRSKPLFTSEGSMRPTGTTNTLRRLCPGANVLTRVALCSPALTPLAAWVEMWALKHWWIYAEITLHLQGFKIDLMNR